MSHIGDPVPGLPPWTWGFKHIWPQYYITSKTGVTPTAKDVIEYRGSSILDVPPPGYDQAPGYDTAPGFDTNSPEHGFSFEAHLWYFRRTSGCTLHANTSSLTSTPEVSTSKEKRTVAFAGIEDAGDGDVFGKIS